MSGYRCAMLRLTGRPDHLWVVLLVYLVVWLPVHPAVLSQASPDQLWVVYLVVWLPVRLATLGQARPDSQRQRGFTMYSPGFSVMSLQNSVALHSRS